MESKYYTTWEEYLTQHPELLGRPEAPIKAKVEKYEDMMFNFVITLLT